MLDPSHDQRRQASSTARPSCEKVKSMPTLTKRKNHVEIHLQPSDPYAGVLTLVVTHREPEKPEAVVKFVLTREELTPIVMAFLSGAQ
jgi:hypothetical protein